METFLDILKERRSIRAFTTTPLTDAQVEQLVEAAQCAPSGQNRQTRQITVLQNLEKIASLRAAIERVLGRPDYHFFGVGTLMLLSDEKENHLGDADCACALENIFLLAAALGLGSCWVNQLRGICDEDAIRPLLDGMGIPKSHIVWGIAALGVPDEQPAPRIKVCPVHYVR